MINVLNSSNQVVTLYDTFADKSNNNQLYYNKRNTSKQPTQDWLNKYDLTITGQGTKTATDGTTYTIYYMVGPYTVPTKADKVGTKANKAKAVFNPLLSALMAEITPQNAKAVIDIVLGDATKADATKAKADADKANKALADAQDKADKANKALADAKAKADADKATKADKAKADKAKADADKANKALADAKADADKANKALADANKAKQYADANKALADAKAKADKAKADADKANKALADANKALADAKADANKALADALADADKATIKKALAATD